MRRCGFIYHAVVTALALAATVTVHAGDYFVNSTAGVNGAGTAPSPWNSLAPLSSLTLKPGDTIYFARGSSFTGGFTVNQSGTVQQPIVVTAYGTGAMPKFTNPSNTLSGNCIQVRGSYVHVDGLYFHAGPHCWQHTWEIVHSLGAVFVSPGANYCVIKNCEITDYPVGLQVKGQHCLITRNYLHDCNRTMCPDDWGPIAIMIGNANNEASWNRIINYIWFGGAFGADGGAFEVDDAFSGREIRNVSIHHNYSYGNCGFLEIDNNSAIKDSINIYYNYSNDYQQFLLNWSGTNSLVANNTVVRVLRVSPTSEELCILVPDSKYRMINNIFVVSGWVASISTATPQVHSNNLFYSADGSDISRLIWPLDPSERIADPKFVAFNIAEPAKMDCRLAVTSPAIGKGIRLGFTVDLYGTALPVTGNPDIGACQYSGVTKTGLQPSQGSTVYRSTEEIGIFDASGRRVAASVFRTADPRNGVSIVRERINGRLSIRPVLRNP